MNEAVYAAAAKVLLGIDDHIGFGEVTLVVKSESERGCAEFTWRAIKVWDSKGIDRIKVSHYILHKDLEFIISPYNFGKRIAERWRNEVRNRK